MESWLKTGSRSMFDLIVNDGRVVNGTGNSGTYADIKIFSLEKVLDKATCTMPS